MLVSLWLLLSGVFTPLLLMLGALSVAVVCYLAIRMKVLEHRGQSIYFRPLPIARYWCWLIVEILKSNWAVTKLILQPSLPIKPLLKAIPAKQKTEVGRVIYANSITLTPGTIAINIAENGDVLIHALHEDSIAELEKGDMGDRVCQLEPPLPSVVKSAGNTT
jgi:multicomponent Na+:H+ antiporter subunit E